MAETLPAGNSYSVTLDYDDYITVTGSATVIANGPVTSVNTTNSGTNQYGPYPSGAHVRVIAIGSVTYTVTTVDGGDGVVRYSMQQNPTLSGASAGAVSKSANLASASAVSIATRAICGRVVNSAGVLGNTFHVTARMAVEFDAVRLVLLNPTAADVVNVKACVFAGGDVASPLNSAASWTAVTFAGNATATLPLAASADVPTLTLSDWIALPGDSSRLVSARLYIPSAGNTTCPVYSGGTLAPWSGKAGEEWISRYQAGDFVGTPSGMNSATNQDNSAIVGIQYLARGIVTTVMGIGDSINFGLGSTLVGDSWWIKAIRDLRAEGARIEVANFGWSTQTSANYYSRATSLIPQLRPSLVVYSAFTPNDGAPTAASDGAMRLNWARARLLANANSVGIIGVDGVPRAASASSSNWTAPQDDFRKIFNRDTVGSLPLYFSQAAVLSNSEALGTASWFKPNKTTDFVHPNEEGNTDLAAVFKPILCNVLQSFLR